MINIRLIAFFLLCSSQYALSQDAVYSLIDRASQYRLNDQYDSALATYQYVVENYPSHGYCPYALESAGDCLRHLKKYNEAINVYRRVLAFPIDTTDPFDTKLGADFKNNVYRNLASMFIEVNHFDSALLYFQEAEKHPRYIMCAYSLPLFYLEDVEDNLKIALCYQKLNNTDTAVDIALANVFAHSSWPDKEIAARARSILLGKYSAKQMSRELQKSVQGLTIYLDENIVKASVIIFGRKVILPADLPSAQLEAAKGLSEQLIAMYKERYKILYTSSNFYKAFADK